MVLSINKRASVRPAGGRDKEADGSDQYSREPCASVTRRGRAQSGVPGG